MKKCLAVVGFELSIVISKELFQRLRHLFFERSVVCGQRSEVRKM